jgi:hypothetical protein
MRQSGDQHRPVPALLERLEQGHFLGGKRILNGFHYTGQIGVTVCEATPTGLVRNVGGLVLHDALDLAGSLGARRDELANQGGAVIAGDAEGSG